MKKILATAIGLAAFSAVYGQGTATLANNIGAVISALTIPGGGIAAGADYKVEVYTYNAANAGGFGTLLGSGAVSPGATGRFNAGTGAEIPGFAPGTTATLIVRAWDVRSGATYDAAQIKGSSASFVTGTLGGDPDGAGPLLPITPVGMVTGAANGFQAFALGGTTVIPEPTTIALGALGAAVLLFRRRK